MKNSQTTPEEKKSANFDEIIKYDAHGRRLQARAIFLLFTNISKKLRRLFSNKTN